MRYLSIAILFGLAGAAQAQWLNHKAPGIPRTKDGKPNLSAPAPRANGKPDLSGLWQTDLAKPGETDTVIPGLGILAVPGDDPSRLSKYFFSVMADYKVEEIMKPEGLQAWQRAASVSAHPCTPLSPPMSEMIPVPNRIVQTPSLIVLLNEVNLPRQIHTDGRMLPVDPEPSYAGYSVGKWDGDTLVVETSGTKDVMPLDGMGHPRTSATHITERYHRRDFGHLDVEVAVNEPKYYTKAMTFRYTKTLIPDDDMLEYVCTDNERDGKHSTPPLASIEP